MPKRTIEIDDTLHDLEKALNLEIAEYLKEYLQENNPDALPCLSNDLDYDGRVHEMVDSSVPVYTHEINTIWYLHGNRIEQSYEDAGAGENPRENDGMSAIYFYLQEQAYSWYSDNAQEIFDTWEGEQAND